MVGDSAQRLFREQGHFPAYRWWTGDGDYTLLTRMAFEKTRHQPAPLELRQRGMAQGEPAAHLARELGLSRKQLHTLRQRIQATLDETEPTGLMTGTTVEADEQYQKAGKTSTPPPDPADPSWRRAIKQTEHGTYANDRPPIIRWFRGT
jgi:hypothetical protein